LPNECSNSGYPLKLMNKLLAFLLVFFAGTLAAQPIALSKAITAAPYLTETEVHPANGSQLNFTIVMFDHPQVMKAVYYTTNVYTVNGKDTLLFASVKDSTSATLVTGLEFGKSYVWNYVAWGKKKKAIFRSKQYGFSVLPLPGETRIHIIRNDSLNNQGGFVSFDYAQLITDRSGKPVWFLPPAKNGEFKKDNQVRDLRLSPAGTVTFLTEKNSFEINPDGRVVWRGPQPAPSSKEYVGEYHHSFQRMKNGNLLTMGTHTVEKQLPGDTAHIALDYGIICEFGRSGRLLWKWDSETYLQDNDILPRKDHEGNPNPSIHMNACTVSDSGHYAWAGFRDLNRVVKIDRFTGKVVASYGTRMPSGEAQFADGFFRRQHDVCVLRNGNIAVFNNDSIADPAAVSSVVIFSQANTPGEESKLVWRFSCKFDSLSNGRSERAGGIEELPNGNYLINMGSLNRCIEISPSKQITWDVFVESWSKEKNTWIAFNQYRSHYIPSLYPVYFTVVRAGKVGSSVTLTIFNEGTEADSYYVEYRMPDGAWAIDQTTPLVPAGGKITVRVLRPGPTGVVFSQMRVRSKTNEDFSRAISLN
jgi:hypothetical protein